MELTAENKAHIDGLSHRELLKQNRFAPAGDPWFQGETGEYWLELLSRKQNEDPAGHTAASKSIAWGKK